MGGRGDLGYLLLLGLKILARHNNSRPTRLWSSTDSSLVGPAPSTTLPVRSSATIDWQNRNFFTMIDTGKLLAVAVYNNKIILLPFPFSPCAYLTQVYIFGWLFRTFRTFLRFEGKIDCRFFENFLWSFLAWKNFLNQWASFPYHSSAHYWQVMKRVDVDACMSAIMHAHPKKVCFECIFRFFCWWILTAYF